MPRGALIVLEGAEGAGKTTQLRRLAEWLTARGAEVVMMREPGGTPIGDQIRRILLDPVSEITPRAESLLFMASRAQLVEQEIRPALERGSVVLLDRFFLSTYAYQGAGRGLSAEMLREANAMATSGLIPDLTILLDVPAELGLARASRRGARDRMEQAELAFHERVRRAFTEFATPNWQASHVECGPIVTVDATGTEAEVFDALISAVAAKWPGFSLQGS
jgi:dTMP kinase